jgi:hypothetical protein
MNVIAFPQRRRWSAAQLAELNQALDAFHAHDGHPEHDNERGGPRDRFMELALAIDPERPIWFWPEDLRCEFHELLKRLGLDPAGRAR